MTPKQRLVAWLGAGAVALAVPAIIQYEGVVQHTYPDPIGIITACVGHTGPELRMGQVFTREQCNDMLYADLLKHAAALDCIKAPLTAYEKAALLSFAFNVGNRAFCNSSLVKKANDGNKIGMCAELSRWTLAGGRELPGLIKRRASERALCEGNNK